MKKGRAGSADKQTIERKGNTVAKKNSDKPQNEAAEERFEETVKKPEETKSSEAEEAANETETETENTEPEQNAQDKSGREGKKAKKALEEKEAKIAELEKALEEEKDKYLRLCAEYDNFRKRAAKEKEALYSSATADSAEQLLPVLDNLERALGAESDKESGMYKGVEMIYSQCIEIFGKMGITEIEADGRTFDPNFHNAVMHDEDPEVGENVITAVFQKGYKLGDKVIRHSVVKVTN